MPKTARMTLKSVREEPNKAEEVGIGGAKDSIDVGKKKTS